jgi:hypothetical protein
MNRLKCVLIGLLSIQSSIYGMWTESKILPNATQKEEAYNQFKTGEDQNRPGKYGFRIIRAPKGRECLV